MNYFLEDEYFDTLSFLYIELNRINSLSFCNKVEFYLDFSLWCFGTYLANNWVMQECKG